MNKTSLTMKKLGAAMTFTMVTGIASANTALYDTYHYLFDQNGQVNSVNWGRQQIVPPDWEAGYFSLGNECQNGCELSKATVLLDAPQLSGDINTQVDLTNLHVEVWGNKANQSLGTDKFPDSKIYGAVSPTNQRFNGNFGTSIDFTFDNTGQALLQPGDYWLVLSIAPGGLSTDIQWFFNGKQGGEFIASSYNGGIIDAGSPYIFRVEGTLSHVPIPGSAWLMGTGLLGLLGARRRLTDFASN